MKTKILFTLFIAFFSGFIFAQNKGSEISVGDVFIIGKVTNNNYKHIDFPRPNFIIKKGGIANYKNILGEKVNITSINEKQDGSLVATIELTSKKLFFNSHKYITVNINDAITHRELLKI